MKHLIFFLSLLFCASTIVCASAGHKGSTVEAPTTYETMGTEGTGISAPEKTKRSWKERMITNIIKRKIEKAEKKRRIDSVDSEDKANRSGVRLLILGAIIFLVGVILGIIPVIGWLVGGILILVGLILAVIGLVFLLL